MSLYQGTKGSWSESVDSPSDGDTPGIRVYELEGGEEKGSFICGYLTHAFSDVAVQASGCSISCHSTLSLPCYMTVMMQNQGAIVDQRGLLFICLDEHGIHPEQRLLISPSIQPVYWD